MDKKAITEEMGVHKEWMAEAKNQTLETLPAFLDRLANGYQHDYGTICYAIAAAGIAAMNAMDNSSSGGITGFQASCLIWEVISAWGVFDEGPKRMLSYHQMLYPQYADTFEKQISQDTWEYLQAEAKKLANDESRMASANVIAHWERIMKGIVPFGYAVQPKETPTP